MRRQQALSLHDPNPIQPTEKMCHSPCRSKRWDNVGVGVGERFLYPQNGAVVSGPWEMFRLTFSPSPEPIRDELIGDSCSGKFMTRAQLPRPWDLSAALDVTR